MKKKNINVMFLSHSVLRFKAYAVAIEYNN